MSSSPRALVSDRAAVDIGGTSGGRAPCVTSHHAFAPGDAEPRAQRGVVEGAADACGERLRVTGRHEEGGLPVSAGDLRQRTTGGGDNRRAARHRLDQREGEPLEQRRHHGQLGATQLVQ